MDSARDWDVYLESQKSVPVEVIDTTRNLSVRGLF